MSVIAGYVSRGGRRNPTEACAKTIEGLARFGPEHQQLRTLGSACFGRALRRTLPEDDFDRQPLLGGGGRYLFVADARIDNRDELADGLRISGEELARLCDADVLRAAWERWQLGCFDRLLGDVALAVWDSNERQLTLARSAISSNPLFYAHRPGFTAFASLTMALHRLEEIPRAVDVHGLAAMAAGMSYHEDRTMFEGVRLVRHGQAIEFRGETAMTRRIWDLDRVPFGTLKLSDYGEALRAELDRSVRARLRRRSGPLVSQLSAGRDSSAVTATAALIQRERGEELIALTGAPREGFAGPTMFGRIADESLLAGETAAFHPNIRHIVCRTAPLDLALQFDRLNRAHFSPILNIRSVHWWTSVNEQAAAEGATMVLGAGTGNLSISAGGLRHLGDLLRLRGWGRWLAAASGRAGLSPAKWKTVANFTFGPFVPEPLYHLAREAARRPPPALPGPRYLRPDLRQEADELLRQEFGDRRPPASNYERRRELLLQREIGEKQTLALWGIDLRDATADRRLVELCLSFPPEQLISADSERPAYEAAFADRLPQAVLTNDRRGYQSADWYEYYRKETVAALFRDYRQHRLVQELFDLDYIDALIAQWPSEGWGKPSVLWRYGTGALIALSLANFVSLHFPE